MTPPRYVRNRPQLRGTSSTPARPPAPRPSSRATPSALHARAHFLALSASSCTPTSPVRGMVRVLNPSCPNCPTVRCHLVPGALARKQLPEAQHLSSGVSACVSECFSVHIRFPTVKSSSSVTPPSRVRSHHRRRRTSLNAAETTAAPRRPVAQ
jgi:hypothetical protein